MKTLRYLLGIGLLMFGVDLIFNMDTGLYACPRCRRALPKGPKKQPHPGFPKKETNENIKKLIKESMNEQK